MSPDIIPFLDIKVGLALERDLESKRFYLLQDNEKVSFDLDYAISELRKRDEEVPVHAKLPVLENLEKIAQKLNLDMGTDIPFDYVHYILTASDITFGLLEPVQITDKESKYNYLPELMEEMKNLGIDDKGIPLCNDNDNFYYMSKNAKVYLYSSDLKKEIEQWENLADWILNEWLINKGK